jgi:hypothetical protein
LPDKLAATAAALAALLVSSRAVVAQVPRPTVGGKIFADLTELDVQSDGVRTSASGTGIDVTRAYIIINEKFDSTWSANLTSDATYHSGQQVSVFIKKAYLQATLSNAFWGRLGSADLPWVPLVEDLYGYRYVEHELVERLRFGTTADWGLHGGGSIDEQRVSYAVSVINGNGYRNPTRSRSLDVEARVAVRPVEGLTAAICGYSGRLGKAEYGANAPTVYHTAERFDALLAYVDHGVRLGVEYFIAKNWNTVTTVEPDGAEGTSAWLSYDISPLWSVFGRTDVASTSDDLAPNRRDRYFDVGFAVHPRANIDLALAYKRERVGGGGLVNTPYGNLGGLLEGSVNEAGIWGQVSF